MMFNSIFERISTDFRQKELIPLKIIFFVQASTLYVLYPYLTIHMRELGINVEETAIMSAITPVVAMVMPPLAGMLADRIGNFRILLSLFSAFGGLAALLLLLVPIGRVTVYFPERVVMDMSCQDRSNSLLYAMSQAHPCEMELQPEIATRVESCGFVCRVETNNETDQDSILKSRFYTIRYLDRPDNLNTSYKYTIAASDSSANIKQQEDIQEHRQLKNNEFFKTSIRQISKTHYFFPADHLYQFSCVPMSERIKDSDNFTSKLPHETHEGRTLCAFDYLSKSKDNINQTVNYHLYKSKIKSLKSDEEDLQEERHRYSAKEISWMGENFRKVICDNSVLVNNRVAINVQLYADNNTNLNATDKILNECNKRCIVTVPRNAICSNINMELEYNINLTFWLYLVIRVFIGIIGGTTFAMFEGAVIAILREQEADYGLQRIYGSIGGMISSPLSGFLIDYASKGKGYTDFRPAFYLYAALKLASGVFMLMISLEFKAPATNVVRDVFTVLSNIETAALFLACFVLGTAWGYIESFLFWLIQDLGGSRSLMGITITVGGIAGIPLLALSGPIISKIGHANVLFIGFVFYAVRLVGYSLVYDPWLTLIFEALESVTSSLSFTAAVTYAAKLSTTSTDSSIQGLLGGVYYGVGKGSGSLIGGYLMKAFGTRPTYRIFSVMTLITGVIYFIFNATYLKKRKKSLEDKAKMKLQSIDMQDNPGKHANDVNLHEEPLDEQVKGNKKNSVDNDGINNEGFLKESQDIKLSKEVNEQNSSQIVETIENAKNAERTERTSYEKYEDRMSKSNITPARNRKSNMQKSCFTNPCFKTDNTNQCEIMVENGQINVKRVDQIDS